MANYILSADKAAISKHGFERVAHVPFIFNSKWQYHRECSTYLIERATCTWPDSKDMGLQTKRFPTTQSLQNYAESLTNFLDWTDSRSLDWRKVSYTEHLYERYQKEMQNGSWSVSGMPLKPTTINRRVDEACNFLFWATARGLRDKFSVLTETCTRRDDSATSSHGHRSREIEARIGRVRADPKSLRLPTDTEIGKWLRHVEIQRGQTKALMCKLVLDTGIRRAEVVAWRVDTLPECIKDWEIIGEQVKVTIKYGCKGQEYGEDHSDKIGPARHIWMSLSTAHALHDYRCGPRLAARAKWVRAASSKEEQRARIGKPSPHLFLSEATGERISSNSLYEAWTGVAYLPFDGWSVHGGRHWWPCKLLLREHQKRMTKLGAIDGVVPLDWISGNAVSDIQLLIRPQLGHINQATSELYVTWAAKILQAEGLQLAYQDLLDDIEAKAAKIDLEITHG